MRARNGRALMCQMEDGGLGALADQPIREGSFALALKVAMSTSVAASIPSASATATSIGAQLCLHSAPRHSTATSVASPLSRRAI